MKTARLARRPIAVAAGWLVLIATSAFVVGLTGGASSPWTLLFALVILAIGSAGGAWASLTVGTALTLLLAASLYIQAPHLPMGRVQLDLVSLAVVGLSPGFSTLFWLAPAARRHAAWEQMNWNERLANLSQAVCLSQDLETALDLTCLGIDYAASAPSRAVLLYDPAEGVLRAASAIGLPSTFVPRAQLSVAETDNGRCLLEGRSIVCLDTRRTGSEAAFVEDPGARAYVLAPMSGIEGLVGALYLSWPQPIRIDDQNLERIVEYADSAGFALQRVRTETDYQRMALTDGLTGLFNLRMLQLRLPGEIARSAREGTPLSLMMLDLDHFKDINDRHGHGTGDQALRCVARALKESGRLSDIPVRYGGEEFLLLSPGLSQRDARHVAERIREAVERTVLEGLGVRVTTSVGVATYPNTAGCAEELMQEADRTLYAAKAAGRACVRVAGQETESAERRP